MENKTVFEVNKKMPCSTWAKGYVKHAWNSLGKKQLADELRYTNALLGFNKFSIIFKDKVKNDGWGKRSQDLVYGFWSEEDLRIKLASELSQFSDYCQIHGQTHIHGLKNEKRMGRRLRNPHIHMYPDLLLVSMKERDQCKFARDDNVEVSAIELKYFSANHTKADLKWAISNDLDKLVDYQKKRLSPRIDCGFFLCLDESGKAGEALRELFKKPKYKEYPLGYGVIVPRYTMLDLNFPRELESLEKGDNRSIYYLLDYVRGQLKDIYFDKCGSPKEQEYGHYLYLNKEPRGWIEIAWPRYVEGLDRKHLGVMLKFYDPNKSLVKNYPQFKWSYKNGGWVKTEKLTGEVLLCKINRNDLSKINWIEEYGDMIASMIRRFYNRVNN